MKKNLLLAIVALGVLLSSSCTTYSLYVEPEIARDMTFYQVAQRDRDRIVEFGGWTSRLHKGFGFGLGLSHVVEFSGKQRDFSYTLLQDSREVAQVDGEYEYKKAQGTLFDGFLSVEATFSNNLTGTATFNQGERLCNFDLSLKEERRHGESVGTVTCGGSAYDITARTRLLSEGGSIRSRDHAQGFSLWEKDQLIMITSVYGRDPYVALKTGLPEQTRQVAAATAALLYYRTLIDF
ncbi:MAG: hypothetical protein ACQEQU_05340 [Spirochaetota bacterium]